LHWKQPSPRNLSISLICCQLMIIVAVLSVRNARRTLPLMSQFPPQFISPILSINGQIIVIIYTLASSVQLGTLLCRVMNNFKWPYASDLAISLYHRHTLHWGFLV
jgi:hypothetical protein